MLRKMAQGKKILRFKRRSNELSTMQERLTTNNHLSTSRHICCATTLSWLIARAVKCHSRRGREEVKKKKKIWEK